MTLLLLLFTIACVTFTLGMLLMPSIISIAKELGLYDIPDERKVHTLPIPRIGGVIFLPVVIITIAVILVILIRLNNSILNQWNQNNIQHVLAYSAGAMMLFTIGLYDDIKSANYKIKFIVQFAAASLLCISGLWIANLDYVFFIKEIPFWIGMPLSVLFVVYITNAINLIDGIDGLASGLAAIGLVTLGILNIITGKYVWAMISFAYLGVILSFFYFNVLSRKHKIFMGDAGSLTLGYTLAFLVLHFWQRNPVWDSHLHNIGIVAMSTLIIPAFDVVRVMMSRLRDHRNPFLPDKNHIHHKLLRAGLSGRMTMVTILAIAFLFIAANYVVASLLSQTLIIITDVFIFCLMHIIINVFIRKKETKDGIKWSRVL